MKFTRLAALALFAVAPAFAGTGFVVDFENNWGYDEAVNGYYNGGVSAGGVSGSNLGVEFVNVAGLSNDADFTYYSGAPSLLGTAYVQGEGAYINVASGVDSLLSFFYSSPTAVTGAIKAYSGLNGSGTLLGSFDLTANSSTSYDSWTQVLFSFAGIAQSFDLSASAGTVSFDNIAAVPEPSSVLLMLAGGAALLGLQRRRKV
jgi:hypothetical protein